MSQNNYMMYSQGTNKVPSILPASGYERNLPPQSLQLSQKRDISTGQKRGMERGQKDITSAGEEIHYLEESISSMKAYEARTRDLIEEEERKIQRFTSEIEEIGQKIYSAKAISREAEKGVETIEMKHEDIVSEQKRKLREKNEIVDQISPSKLSKISFKSHLDTSNDIFKWVLEAIYKEPKGRYEWKNFKKQAFKKDKGEDFLVRLKLTPVKKMQKESFVFGRNILDRKNEILADLERKGPNSSLRSLFNYLKLVVETGEGTSQIESEQESLRVCEQKFKNKKQEEKALSNQLWTLDEKVRVGTHMIGEMRKMSLLASQSIQMLRQRIEQQRNSLGQPYESSNLG